MVILQYDLQNRFAAAVHAELPLHRLDLGKEGSRRIDRSHEGYVETVDQLAEMKTVINGRSTLLANPSNAVSHSIDTA